MHPTLRRLLAALAVAVALHVDPVDAAAQFLSVRVQVIDVGQADAILIRTPNAQYVLIDAGVGRVLADSLTTHFGVDRLALAVGSHRHRDHIGGMDNVLNRISADLYVADTLDNPRTGSDDIVRDTVRLKGVTVQGPGADTIVVDGVDFIVLPQPPRVDASDENDNSIVVRMEFGEFSMLFAGDIEHEGQGWLNAHHPTLLDVDVLKASHHGADNGWSEAWLDATSPAHVVISAGVNATYRHPQAEAVAAYDSVTGGRVFCTNRHGTIRVYGYADGRVTIFRQRPQVTKSCTYDGTWYGER